MKNPVNRTPIEIANELDKLGDPMVGLAENGRQLISNAAAMLRLIGPGVMAFAIERNRQIDKGFNPAHDDKHDHGELAIAAALYATPDFMRLYDFCSSSSVPAQWPFEASAWNRSTRKREIEKAGALLAAELERLERAEKNMDGGYLGVNQKDRTAAIKSIHKPR